MTRLGSFIRRERLYMLVAIFVGLMSYATMMADRQMPKPEKSAVVTDKQIGQENAQAKKEDIERKLSENSQLAVTMSLVTLLVLLVMVLGFVLDGLFLSMRFAGKPLEIRTYLPETPPWNLWDVFKVTMLFLFFGYMMVLIESALVRIFPVINNDNIRMVFNSAVLDTLIVVFILYFTAGQYGAKIAELGLTGANFGKNLFYGMVGYIATVPVLAAVLALTAYVTNMMNYVPERQAVVELFLKEKDTAFLLFTSLFAAIAGPIIEELFFRGFLYNAVKKYAGILTATIVSAVFFASVHAHAVGFAPILVLGIVLAYLYEKTGSLVSSMTMHAVHNLSMVSLVFLIKQFG